MSGKMSSIKENYIELSKKYKTLGANIEQAIKIFLDEEKISYLTVYHRVKDVDSFVEKIDRKGYEEPFEQIEDVCGIRIICYYKSDVDKICEIIEREFQVVESQDKEKLLQPNQFGYRSHHFIIKIKDKWLCTPNYKGLANLKAEIQVRTNLMHTWAEIEHKLEYKKEQDIPPQFKRKFSFLSAKLEEADEQFEALKKDITEFREQYKEKMINSREKNKQINEDDVKVNLDTLQAFLDLYYGDRSKNSRSTSELVQELNNYRIDMRMLTEYYKETNELVSKIEKEYTSKQQFFSQVGMMRIMLRVCNDEYLKGLGVYNSKMEKITNKYREQLYK